MSAPVRLPILEVLYANPTRPGLGLETFRLSELLRRIPRDHLRNASRPDFHLLMLFVAGATWHEVDFAKVACAPGTLIHVRPGQVQRFAPEQGAEAIVVLFVPGFVLPSRGDDALHGWLAAPWSAACRDLPETLRPAIRRGFDRIDDEYAHADGGRTSEVVLRHLLHALLTWLAPAPGDCGGTTERAAGAVGLHARFMRMLEGDFARQHAVAHYAGRLGCTAKTLGRACLAVEGVPPKALIDRRVALEAKRLLAHTALAVGTVGIEVGFDEASNFVKFFRREAGTTPGAFRAAQRSRG